MYFGDKLALEDLKNCSVCVSTDAGIRRIRSEKDLILKNIVYVENILPTNCEHLSESSYVISEGDMVRYRPIYIILR